MRGVRVKLGDSIAGRYRLDAVAGRGGIGVVHRATDTASGRRVQVTVLSARIRAVLDPTRVEPVRDALRSLTVATLAVPLDVTVDPPALVTIPVTGRSLAGLIAEGPLEEGVVTALGADLAAGIAALHARGLTHRWIRPSTIAVEEGRPPVLLDVGVTELLEPQYYTAFERLIGTTAYVSPEQVWNERVGPATDVYALGLVLIEALTGRPALPTTTAADAVARTLTAPDVPMTADPRLAQLLTTATAFRPEDRPSAAELAAGLRALLTEPAAVRPVVPFRRRHAVLVAGGLALLAAAVLGSGSGTPEGAWLHLSAHHAGASLALGAERVASPLVRPASHPEPSHPAAARRPVRVTTRARPSAAPIVVSPDPARTSPAPPRPLPQRAPSRPAAVRPASHPAPAPHPTARPTATPTPTPTVTPSAAPAPTSPPTSTPTPTPTPTPSVSPTTGLR